MAVPVQQLGIGFLEQGNPFVDRAWNPIHRPDLIQHRAADTELGVGFQFRLARRIITGHRIHQPDDADGDQIVGV